MAFKWVEGEMAKKGKRRKAKIIKIYGREIFLLHFR